MCPSHAQVETKRIFFFFSYIYSYIRYLAIWGLKVLTIKIKYAKFVIQNQFSANHIARKSLSKVTKMINL